jgi:hypothetical protein
VEYKADTLTKGTRVFLQFDASIEDDGRDPSSAESEGGSTFDYLSGKHGRNASAILTLETVSTAEKKAIDGIVSKVRALLKERAPDEIGFPLRFMYEQAELLPQNLKGIDATLYKRLSGQFKVELHNILLIEEVRSGPDYDGTGTRTASKIDLSGEQVQIKRRQREDEGRPRKKLKTDSSRQFHIPKRCQIQKLDGKEEFDWGYGERQSETHRYFVDGLFISSK